MTTLPMTLRENDHGENVRALQRALNNIGAKLAVDGWFGVNTTNAVIKAQQHFGLAIDGIAGPQTLQTLIGITLTPNHLSAADLNNAALSLGVELAVIRAFNEIESRGSGFLPDGRPKILFERHIMYRQLKATSMDADALALQFPSLVNTKRGGYIGGSGEHTRLAQASQIHRACALASTSWGMFQVMGFHWKPLSYESVEAFADLMHTGEAAQLDAFVRFVRKTPRLVKALQAKKWTTVAEIYNGPDYKTHRYDIKLSSAYHKYKALEIAS